MAIATKSSGIGGKWLDKKTLKTGDIAKIKTEATEQPSQQEGKTQWVCKLHVKGQVESLNFAINTQSKNALIDAFGEDTNNWIDKLLALEIEKTVIAGKRGVAAYLIPDGFELKEDSGGYLVIVKKGQISAAPVSNDYPQEEIDPNDIPF